MSSLISPFISSQPQQAAGYLFKNKVIDFNEFDELGQKLEATRDIIQAALVQIENESRRNKEQEEIMTYLRELASSYSKLSLQSGKHQTKPLLAAERYK